MNTAVAFSACHSDDYLFDHFILYYQKLGVKYFLANFAYFTLDRANDVDEIHSFYQFVDKVKEKYPFIISNTAVHEFHEGDRMPTLNRLLKEVYDDISYVIPADSDEFHEFFTSKTIYHVRREQQVCGDVNYNCLSEAVNYMNEYHLDACTGSTVERINNTIININNNINIFDQFPLQNNKLPSLAKVGLVRKECFYKIGHGHHFSPKGLVVKNNNIKLYNATHHFRWSEERKKKLQMWIDRFSHSKWKGWKNTDTRIKHLELFNNNLLTYRN